jgi:hypothetical protein
VTLAQASAAADIACGVLTRVSQPFESGRVPRWMPVISL